MPRGERKVQRTAFRSKKHMSWPKFAPDPPTVRLKRRLTGLQIRKDLLARCEVIYEGWERDVAINAQEIADCEATIRQAAA